MEQKPFTLHYRHKYTVTQGTILATSEENAMKVGQAWCNLDAQRRFIRVENPVLADESILSTLQVQQDETAMDAVSRYARAQNLSYDEALDALRNKRRTVKPQEAKEAAKEADLAAKK